MASIIKSYLDFLAVPVLSATVERAFSGLRYPSWKEHAAMADKSLAMYVQFFYNKFKH